MVTDEITVVLSPEGITKFIASMLSEIAIDNIIAKVTILNETNIHFELADLKLLIQIENIENKLIN